MKDYSKIGSSPDWSPEEIQVLKADYSRKGLNIPFLLERRTRRTIMRKACELHLRHPKYWTSYELRLLREKYPELGAGIPELKRTKAEIRTKASDLGIKCKNDGRIKKGERHSPKTEFGNIPPQKYFKEPTFPEKRLIKIVEAHHLPLKYVGCGDFIVGGINPDFVCTNGKKGVVEIFNDYWHGRTPRFTPKDWRRTEIGRATYLRQFGYDTLILWTSELEIITDSEIACKIQGFLR